MKIPAYDIFSGSTPQDAMWLEAVEGFGAACEKMKEHAKKSPGAYFVSQIKARDAATEIIGGVRCPAPREGRSTFPRFHSDAENQQGARRTV